MDRVAAFLVVAHGDGSGSGDGYGYGSGYGDGYGDGSGDGSGDGFGSGYGSDDGSGDGSDSGYGDGPDYGNGDGYGDGYGSGYGDGYGDGDDYGSGVTVFNGMPVHAVDGVQTVIVSVRGNVAKGFVLNQDLTTTPCFVVRNGDCFAHGETLREATEDARARRTASEPLEDRIAACLSECGDGMPGSDWFRWHGILTGSCRMGREQFVNDRGVDMNKTFTLEEFVALTKDAYGGDSIRKLLDFSEKRGVE